MHSIPCVLTIKGHLKNWRSARSGKKMLLQIGGAVFINIYDSVYLFFARALYVIQKACFFSRDATELQLQTKDVFFKSPKPDLR